MILVHLYLCLLDLCLHFNSFDGNNDNELQIIYFYWVDLLIVISFLDMIIKFNSGYFMNGSQVLERKAIIHFYLKSEFLFDSFSLLSLFFENFCAIYDFSLITLIKITFCFKIPILKRLIERLEEIINFDEKILALISLFKLFVKMLFLCHAIACIWFIIPYWNPDKNWLTEKGISTKSVVDKYEFSLYWACVTIATIGYGDIVPQNSDELIFTLIVTMIGSIFFGYTLTSIATIFKELERDKIGKK